MASCAFVPYPSLDTPCAAQAFEESQYIGFPETQRPLSCPIKSSFGSQGSGLVNAEWKLRPELDAWHLGDRLSCTWQAPRVQELHGIEWNRI